LKETQVPTYARNFDGAEMESFEIPTVTQSLKNFPAFYEARRFHHHGHKSPPLVTIPDPEEFSPRKSRLQRFFLFGL
jgi:hypothetical protein